MFLRNLEVIRGISFDILVCDEAHRLKNSSTKTASAISGLAVKRRVALTGTPVQNDLEEFYTIADFCNPGVLSSPSVRKLGAEAEKYEETRMLHVEMY